MSANLLPPVVVALREEGMDVEHGTASSIALAAHPVSLILHSSFVSLPSYLFTHARTPLTLFFFPFLFFFSTRGSVPECLKRVG